MNTIQTIIDFIKQAVMSAFQVSNLHSLISLYFVTAVGLIVPILISVAYFTHLERKGLATVQRRMGPNVIGVYGMLQPLADGFKLFIKESLLPSSANSYLFAVAPMITFTFSLLSWCLIPFGIYATMYESSLSSLYMAAVTTLGVYGVFFSGWASNSKFPFLGSLRSTAQMVAYEAPLGFTLIVVVAIAGSFDLQEIVEDQVEAWNIFLLSPIFMLFFIAMLAETNRHPFDLPEAESELVSGYNVEYSGMQFALFSLGEYSFMLLMGSFATIFFFGGWLSPFHIGIFSAPVWFGIKVCVFAILFVWIRAAIPRYRYDQLMHLGWTVFLPLSLLYVIFIPIIMYVLGCFPN
jgi:NADH-quinone oxidoreductase subunit H